MCSAAVGEVTDSSPVIAVAPVVSGNVEDIILADSRSPFKGKKGIPHWYKGKISPAFERHIFWPSPPKKKKSSTKKKTLFPACASSSVWRQLYSENKKVQSEVISQNPGGKSEQGKKSKCEKRTKEKVEGLPQAKRGRKASANQNRRKKSQKKCTRKKAGDDDHAPCHFCGKCYNTKEDDKLQDDWWKCSLCDIWSHETCGEENGVIGDDEFICKNCIN